MRFFRFYITEQILTDPEIDFFIKDPKIIHKIKNVLRFTAGHKITLFNGDGFDYDFIIQTVDLKKVNLRFVEKRQPVGQQTKIKINLFVSLIKKDKFEWILEKGTELGVSSFQPILSKRSEKKNFAAKRGEIKIIEALEQSGRSSKPVLLGIKPLSKVLGQDFVGTKIFLSLNSKTTMRDLLVNKNIKEINIFVGPEGGWSDLEEELFKKNNFLAINLGSAILKTETACLAVVAKLSS